MVSCEFAPSEIPNSDIEEPSPIGPELLMEITPGMDTLRLSEPIWINYTVDADEEDVYAINFFLNGVQIGEVYHNSRTNVNAYIKADTLNDGNHELAIGVLTSTNSESIADQLGYEAYAYELQWPVYVNKNAKKDFGLTELEPIPEGARLNWTAYNYADFDSYEFSWYFADGLKGEKVISDPNQNYFIHDNFVEGCYISYNILLRFKEHGFKSDQRSYSEEIGKPEVRINNDLTVDLNWSPSRLEKNVKNYCVATSAPNYGISEEHDITNLIDTSFTLDYKIGFAGDYQVQLRYIPKGYERPHSFLNTNGGLTQFALGESFPKFQKLFKVKSDETFLTYNENTYDEDIWLKFDPVRGDTLKKISIKPPSDFRDWTVTASPAGNYFGSFENQEYVIRKGSDMAVVNSLSLDAFNGYNLRLESISISDNGLIAVTEYGKDIRIYSIETGDVIFKQMYKGDGGIGRVFISSDGEKIAWETYNYDLRASLLTYYQFDGDSLIEIDKLEVEYEEMGETLAFSPDGNTLVYSRRRMHDYHLEMRDADTFELLYKTKVPHLFVPVAYDFVEDRVIAQYRSFPTKDHSYLIDMKSGKQQKIVQFTGRETILFDQGRAYAGNGRWIDVDDYYVE